jgi:hypothetical protein
VLRVGGKKNRSNLRLVHFLIARWFVSRAGRLVLTAECLRKGSAVEEGPLHS